MRCKPAAISTITRSGSSKSPSSGHKPASNTANRTSVALGQFGQAAKRLASQSVGQIWGAIDRTIRPVRGGRKVVAIVRATSLIMKPE
jgi:hypothetical protein